VKKWYEPYNPAKLVLHYIDATMMKEPGRFWFRRACLSITVTGIIHIKGSVQDTYNVFAKKDIVVGGNVGNAVIQTDGNLEVKGGIVGKNKGLIRVGGDVRAKFAENANIQAGQDIHIQRAALNCKMIAGSRIVALQEKGQIIGAKSRQERGSRSRFWETSLNTAWRFAWGRTSRWRLGLRRFR